MPTDPYEPSPHLSDYCREQDRLRRQHADDIRRAAELRQQQRARFNQLTAKLMDRAEALLDRLPSAQPAAAARTAGDLDLTAARRQFAHIVRAPLLCSRAQCRRSRACCGEPKQCLAVYLPLLPAADIAALLLEPRKTRRSRVRPAR